MNDRERILTELDRITTRLSGLNLTRLDSCAHAIHSCAQEILGLTPNLTSNLTLDAQESLPIIGLSGVSAQLTVITRNYLECTESRILHSNDSVDVNDSVDANDSIVAELLTQLRRDLP